ncbi:MAG: sugar kinase [Herpetosiphonaceae bacterium]|nr:sugar kinase [Herpetosiphonaceae bacterium]
MSPDSERPFDLLVVGELNPDLVLRGDVTPAFGQVEQLVDDATLTIGSSSAIFACGAARLGLRVAFVGKIGDDIFGHFMRDELAGRRIDVSGVVVDQDIRTGLSVILSRGNDRAILTYSGSIGALHYEEIDLRLLGRARHLHLGAYFMLDTLRPHVPLLFAAARSAGLTLSLDTNYDPSEQWNGGLDEVLPLVDVFLPNEAELLAITRQATLDDALDSLTSQVPLIGVKLGVKGGLARRGNETVQAAPLPVQVKDTTGAGDSFDAGFVYGYLQGWTLERTLRLACACGALSTRAAGGTAAQPTLRETGEVA